MWMSFAGRLSKEFVNALNEYGDTEIEGYEMVEDFKWDKKYEAVTCITILDAGLHSLKDWSVVRALNKHFKAVPIILCIRDERFLPDASLLGENVIVKHVENEVYLSALVKEMEERADVYETEWLQALEGVE